MKKVKNILFATNSQKVLNFFLDNPTKEFVGKDLVKNKLGISRSGIYYALKELSKDGFLHEYVNGWMHFYSLNHKNIIVKQLKVLKTMVEIRPLIERLKKFSSKIILFGSISRGESVKDSDIDLFIITHNKKAIEKEVSKFKSKRKIEIVKKTELEYVEMKKRTPVFFEQINKGILLWEAEDES